MTFHFMRLLSCPAQYTTGKDGSFPEKWKDVTAAFGSKKEPPVGGPKLSKMVVNLRYHLDDSHARTGGSNDRSSRRRHVLGC